LGGFGVMFFGEVVRLFVKIGKLKNFLISDGVWMNFRIDIILILE